MSDAAGFPALETDQPTIDLIIQLQLEDAGLYLSSAKGKSPESVLSDLDLAFQLQNQELEHSSQLLSDRRMAMSLAIAVQTDGEALSDDLIQENRASRDGGGAHPPTTEGSGQSDMEQLLDDETLAKLQILYMPGMYDLNMGIDTDMGENEQAESSSWAAGRASPPQSQLHQCVGCQEMVSFLAVARAPCQHEYCRTCLEDLFRAAMMDESLFPPRCCRQHITVQSVRFFLKSDTVREFEKKKVEFETPNRTYCYSPTCSAFIPPSNIDGDVATCAECRLTTCTTCKARAHTGDCPHDTDLQSLLVTARENGWQRCSCSRIVELDIGCNHITCHCGSEFCYICGASWKTCPCRQWEEDRLLARANQIVDRNRPQAANAAPARDPAVVAREVENLRENHECEHDEWLWTSGPHRCEECSCRLPEYIFQCAQCRLQLCNRCRRNRV